MFLELVSQGTADPVAHETHGASYKPRIIIRPYLEMEGRPKNVFNVINLMVMQRGKFEHSHFAIWMPWLNINQKPV